VKQKMIVATAIVEDSIFTTVSIFHHHHQVQGHLPIKRSFLNKIEQIHQNYL
jgi:hypothetical protein